MDALVVQIPRTLVAAAAAAAPHEAAGTDVHVAAQAVRAGTVSGGAAALRSDLETALATTRDDALADRLDAVRLLADAAETFAGRSPRRSTARRAWTPRRSRPPRSPPSPAPPTGSPPCSPPGRAACPPTATGPSPSP